MVSKWSLTSEAMLSTTTSNCCSSSPSVEGLALPSHTPYRFLSCQMATEEKDTWKCDLRSVPGVNYNKM